MHTTLIDLQLLSSASHFNLKEPAERRRSVNELINLFYLLQDGLKPDFCLEIGAFDANFSQRMSSQGTTCYAFEANPYNYNKFKDKLDVDNLNYIHSAISDTVGSVTFSIQKSINGDFQEPVSGNNSLITRTAIGIEYEQVEVPSTTLERFLKYNNLNDRPYGMWVDVEGASSLVLSTSGEALKTCQSILIEVEDHAFWESQWLSWDVTDFLVSIGFVPVARDFESHFQYNVVYLRKDLMHNKIARQALTTHYTRIGKQWL